MYKYIYGNILLKGDTGGNKTQKDSYVRKQKGISIIIYKEKNDE